MQSNLEKFTYNQVSTNIQRSKIGRDFEHVTTFNSGKLIPIYVEHAQPGDTLELSMASVVRMLSPVVPTMGQVVMDVYFFSVPYRLLDTYANLGSSGSKIWAQVCGENTSGYWTPATEKVLAEVGFTKAGAGSLGNYLGLPIVDFNLPSSPTATDWENAPKINALELGAYVVTWNEYFRDQNVQAPKGVGDVLSYYRIGGVNRYFYNGAQCFNVNRLHDYFTSCLPAPQKGPAVTTPLGTSADIKRKTNVPDTFVNGTDSASLSSGNVSVSAISGATNTSTLHANSKELYYDPKNLYADLTTATASTINQLRTAFAIQRLYEKDARGGTRYREIIKAHFNTTIKDSTVQVPEYLGGKRIPIVVNQVIQSSAGDGSTTTELGTTGAFSNTNDKSNICIKSFDEHCVVLGLACIRNKEQYSQGIDCFKTKFRRFDFYRPAFANLGEKAVLQKELYVTGNPIYDEQVFGYQEAWAEYRYHPSLITGNVAPAAGDASLAPYSYSNNFNANPTLSGFIPSDPAVIGNTLYDTSTTTQFLADFFFKNTWIRPMPVVSIPGLIDHN